MEIGTFLLCHGLPFVLIMTIISRTIKQIEKQTCNEKEEIEEESDSQLKQTYCAICMDEKPIEEMFENRNCSHTFCETCVGSYLDAKIKENIAMVKCPDPNCNDILEPNDCISIIPKDVFERWENALCENLVLGSQKFYCPFNDCSAMLVNDGNEVVTVSECPHCHRLFCAQCKVSWHAGVDCTEFQSLKNSDQGCQSDLTALQFAKKKKWKRCSKCSFYVERSEGCNKITCRCRHQFCYVCGSDWKPSHHDCKEI
ncbi:E3 ubiquitin-protein ligase RSL1-like [Trifolium pratense]|uniref:E3 ubiquitin-protein ligase RSL1-like n=1 Tax=Trifolium pratense TaxID=57577 RepID=UPI001E6958CF|nr:E3 ubiquitin-protein ligase RSL1-like [Trifolium pratense]